LLQKDQSSIDLSTNPALKVYQITFPCAQSVPASSVTIVWIFKEVSLTAIHQWSLRPSSPISDQIPDVMLRGCFLHKIWLLSRMFGLALNRVIWRCLKMGPKGCPTILSGISFLSSLHLLTISVQCCIRLVTHVQNELLHLPELLFYRNTMNIPYC
jgi:hypothetical protein